MQPNNDFSIAFYIGSYGVRWYSILVFCGFLFAYIFAIVRCKQEKIETKYVENFIYILFPVSIVFARIWYILGDLNQFIGTSFVNYIDVSTGGLAIEGGVLGGLLCGFLWFKRASSITGVPLMKYADIVLPNMLIGQAIGRWGNFFNQELLGQPTDSSFVLNLPDFIKNHLRTPYEANGVIRQPLFLYESFFDFILWIILVWVLPLTISKKSWYKNGTLFFVYFLCYGILRIILEPMRMDVYIMKIGNAPVTIILSSIFIVFGTLSIGYLYLQKFLKANKKQKVAKK